ncbi:MAG: ABC transporter substrate-binding protein [Promethearchaeota archaeon]
MKKNTNMLIITLLLASFFLPTIQLTMPIAAQELLEIPTFTVGTAGPQSTIEHWSMEAYDASYGDYYLYNALEPLYLWPYNAENGSLDNLIPVIAKNWTIHNRPIEHTAKGFMAYEGIDYMDITLRENVKFHDGSDWNATVCKWNIDRTFVILGDINNALPDYPESSITVTRPIYWMKIDEWDDYATNSWNVSKLTPGVYANYPQSMDKYYNGSQGALYARFPRFQNVTILDDKQSGGTVRVYFNDWGSGPNYLANFEFISMQAYKDYFEVPILGYGNNPSFPQGNPSVFPGHLIGTGPYIFESHDDVTGLGKMHRNDNWWNASAQQAEGWHMLQEVAIQAFPHGQSGYQTRTNALISGDIDYATDREWEPIEYSTITTAVGANYVDMGIESYGETIVLNCIDETYLKYWSDINYDLTYYIIPRGYGNETSFIGTAKSIEANGINRAFRKALSYAFDYNTYIDVTKAGRVVRSGGLLGKSNEYYDPTTPLAYFDVTKAREALLNDTFWEPICNAHSLYDTDDDWEGVAASVTPIYTMEYHWDQAHEDAKDALEEALTRIGCKIDAVEDEPNTYGALFKPLTDPAATYPIFSNDGFAISPFHARFNDLGYIQAYLQSPGVVERSPINSSGYPVISDYPYSGYPVVPYPHYIPTPLTTWPYTGSANMGFNYNETCDDLIFNIWFANETEEINLYKELTEWIQDFQYPVIYISNGKTGYAVRNEWEVKWSSSFFTFTFNFVKYMGPQVPPAFPWEIIVIIVIAVSLLSFVGVVYTNRRRKRSI